MLFVCYPKCKTCQKAQKWLDDHGIAYELRDIKINNPTTEELSQWHLKSGLPIRKFWNTSGLQYKALGLKDRISTMNEEEQLNLLSTDGMLIKRPILVDENFALIGFKESEWEVKVGKLKPLSL